MGGKKIKVQFKGEEVEATPIEVTSSNENWNNYLLDDGTTLKLKVVVTGIARIDDEYDAEGNPIYIMKSTNVLGVDAPEKLQRR